MKGNRFLTDKRRELKMMERKKQNVGVVLGL